MPQNERFTAWLTAGEKRELEQLAKREQTSVNYQARKAIRQFLNRKGVLNGSRDTQAT